MREILFRGKTIAKNEWYYGSYLFCHLPDYDWTGKASAKSEDVHFIVNEKDINLAVHPETVSQFTGLHDKNGQKIFENDIVVFTKKTDKLMDLYTVNGVFTFQGYVEYNNGNFFVVRNRNDCIKGKDQIVMFDANTQVNYHDAKIEVIGNIFDNPELLEGINNA